MSKFRLSRRAVLRGAGAVAIALPWLEIMGSPRESQAAAAPAKRFLSVYNPGGTILEKWRPTGTENDFALSPILAPFESVKSRILVLDGLELKSALGQAEQRGMVALLTGTPQGADRWSQGPSLDQVLAQSMPPHALSSLQMAVRWGTGKAYGLVSPFDILNFERQVPYAPIAPRIDPVAIWNELFGGQIPTDNAAVDWDRSILDAVGQRYAALVPRLGKADKERVEQHLTHIREMERRLADVARVSEACRAPELVDTSDYDPFEGLNSASDGSVVDAETDAAIPKVGRLMMDMMVTALACDLTSVGTLQWCDAEAKYTLPWLGLKETHVFYQHDGGFDAAACEVIAHWYSEQHAYLVQRMADIDMGGHSLLDESVVFFGTDLQNPNNSSKIDMPFLLAGSGGGLRPGRFVRYERQSHNNLLVSLANLCGDPRTSFGTPEYCTGPLTNLT